MNISHQNLHEADLLSKQSPLPFVPPPRVPAGYTVLDRPRPLTPEEDNLWMALAWSDTDVSVGVLVYSEGDCSTFLLGDEALTMIHHLLEWSACLIAHCSPQRIQLQEALWHETTEAWQTWCQAAWHAMCGQARLMSRQSTNAEGEAEHV